ncbi:MAG TPA: hypothetical protein VNF50_12185 [Acidimicrobiales bacterium]|nr:hypothetical protein [Acidimicrobiales bacterium]
MLEVLDPISRVGFLLTGAFGYPSSDVSAAIGNSPAACRQIESRARTRIRQAKPSRPSPADRVVADRLLLAVASGDTGAAMARLSGDVVLVADGGPKRLSPGVRVEPVLVNAAAGFLLRHPAGDQNGAVAFDVTNGIVSAIWTVNNPDKLTCLDSPALIS